MANQPTTQEIKDYIVQRAKANGVDPNQALALAGVESSYKPDATSKTGAAGIFQMFPAASSDAGYDYDKVKSDWRTNVDAGITYYKQKLDEAGGNVPMALGYYNQGKGGFDKQLQSGQLVPEVKKYISNPAFAPFVNDTLSQTGNPIAPLLASQKNVNKFDRAALFRDNIGKLPTQAEAIAQGASTNAPIAQQSNLDAQLRQQKLDTAQLLQTQREQQIKDIQDQQDKDRNAAIQNAGIYLVSSILGSNKNTAEVVSGQNAGRSTGAQYGVQTQRALANMSQQFANPNRFMRGNS